MACGVPGNLAGKSQLLIVRNIVVVIFLAFSTLTVIAKTSTGANYQVASKYELDNRRGKLNSCWFKHLLANERMAQICAFIKQRLLIAAERPE